MKKNLLIILLSFSVLTIYGQTSSGYYEKNGNIYYRDQFVTNVAYQQNADIIRLRHLDYYGRLIQKYHAIKGHYPFQSDSPEPVYIYVAHREQMKFTEAYEKGLPFKHRNIPFSKFILELEKVLGVEVDEYYDPQAYPDAKWNWYLYSVQAEVFYFAVHVHQKFPFSKFVSPYCNKIEISNISNRSANLIVEVNELLESELFKAALNQPVLREGHFLELEKKYLHDTKTDVEDSGTIND